MEKVICAVLLICCGGVFARTSYESNQYMDTVLFNNLPNEGRNYNVDPARISNFSSEQTDKVFGMKVKVRMDYYNGEMTGLFKVRRYGDCSPARRDFGNVTLNCTLVFNGINVRYQAKMKYGVVPTTTISAVGNMSSTYVFVEVTTSQTRNYPSVRRLQLTQTGSFKDKISGLGPLNGSLAKLVKEAFVGRITSEFFNVFNYNFSPSLARAASRSPMPFP